MRFACAPNGHKVFLEDSLPRAPPSAPARPTGLPMIACADPFIPCPQVLQAHRKLSVSMVFRIVRSLEGRLFSVEPRGEIFNQMLHLVA